MALIYRSSAIFAFTAMCLNVSAGEAIHIVRRGETLSNILYNLNLEPIYGKNGALKEALLLNPKISIRKNYKIYPGEKIKLSIVNLDNKNILTEKNGHLLENHETRLGEVQVNPKETENLESKPTILVNQVDREQFIFMRLSPQISWLKATSTNTNQYQNSQISALSKANPGALGAFGINVSENFNVQAFAYLSEVNFYQDEQYNLPKSSFVRQAYGLASEYRLDPKNRFSLRAGFFDEFYLTMNDTTTINIETAQIPEIHWGYRRILGQYKNVTLDSGIFGKFIIPYSASTINGRFGYGLGGDFLLMLKNKGLRFFYNYSDAKALNKSTQTFELGWNIVFEGRMYE